MKEMDFPGFIVLALTIGIILVLNRIYKFDTLTSVAIGGAIGFCASLILNVLRRNK
ncbi:hypothetical protein BDE36_1692 [Arcticibacter tournemirensis]|nr:hypothetical protein BDE36_1692 [Arcticibacter tournemirensis]